MLAQTSYAEFSPAEVALSHKRAVRALTLLPYRQRHRLLVSGSRLEAWLRWPVRTMNASDRIGGTFSTIDPDGTRFGLNEVVRRRFKESNLYESVPDLFVLLSSLDDQRFRREALTVHNGQVLAEAREAGPGAIIVGFRLGPHAALPYALGAIGHDTSMIVASAKLARIATEMGAEFAPRSSRRVEFIEARDSLVLARASEALNRGRLVCTLMELPADEFQKTTPVRFLDWNISVPYGIPYLAAVTGRPIIPATITRWRGPKFRLSFLEPIPAPGRDRSSIFEATQALYSKLEGEVRRYPAQWIGWTLLESHMGIDVRQAQSAETMAQS